MRDWLATLWQRICWQAWNYARKREIARLTAKGSDASHVIAEMTPDQRRIVANEARQAWENKHIQAAFAEVAEFLEAKALSCDPDDKDAAQRIVISKKLMAQIKAALNRKIDDGYMAEIEVVELQRRGAVRAFRR